MNTFDYHYLLSNSHMPESARGKLEDVNAIVNADERHCARSSAGGTLLGCPALTI